MLSNLKHEYARNKRKKFTGILMMHKFMWRKVARKLANKAIESLSVRTNDSNLISDTSLGLHKISQAPVNLAI